MGTWLLWRYHRERTGICIYAFLQFWKYKFQTDLNNKTVHWFIYLERLQNTLEHQCQPFFPSFLPAFLYHSLSLLSPPTLSLLSQSLWLYPPLLFLVKLTFLKLQDSYLQLLLLNASSFILGHKKYVLLFWPWKQVLMLCIVRPFLLCKNYCGWENLIHNFIYR